MATDRSTSGMPVYPKAAPSLRVVRGAELRDLFRAVKSAFHDLVSSSCTSGRMAAEGALRTNVTSTRNHSSSFEESGRGGGFHMSLTFSAARESIAVISGSGSDNASTPEGGNAAESSSLESHLFPEHSSVERRAVASTTTAWLRSKRVD